MAIKEFKNTPIKDSSIVFRTSFEKVRELYPEYPELAAELAMSVLELSLTGDFSSDNIMIKMMLKETKEITDRNNKKWEESKESKQEARIAKLKLEQIASMLSDGMSQKAIAEALNESPQTINNRVKVLRSEFAHLLDASNQKNQILSNEIQFDQNESLIEEASDQKIKKNKENQKDVNVNVNENVNVNVARVPRLVGASPQTPLESASPPPQQEPKIREFEIEAPGRQPTTMNYKEEPKKLFKF